MWGTNGIKHMRVCVRAWVCLLVYVCVWPQIPSILCRQAVLLPVLRTGSGCSWLHCTGNKIGKALNHVFILPALSALPAHRHADPAQMDLVSCRHCKNVICPGLKILMLSTLYACLHACIYVFLIFVWCDWAFVLNAALLARTCLKEILIFHIKLVPC